MRLLVAVQSNNNPEALSKVLRWAGRAGYALRVFTAAEYHEQTIETLKDIAYQHYIHFPSETTVSDIEPIDYARELGFDLLCTLPDSLKSFTGKTMKINLDEEVFAFCEAVGTFRAKMGKEDVNKITMENGVTLERV